MKTLPPRYVDFRSQYPELFAAYESLGKAAGEAGPLDEKTRELVRLGMALGARLEGATHSHVRRASEVGCSKDEIRHAALLGVTTLGFPAMNIALAWVEDVLGTE